MKGDVMVVILAAVSFQANVVVVIMAAELIMTMAVSGAIEGMFEVTMVVVLIVYGIGSEARRGRCRREV
jgi:hypothetical protein